MRGNKKQRERRDSAARLKSVATAVILSFAMSLVALSVLVGGAIAGGGSTPLAEQDLFDSGSSSAVEIGGDEDVDLESAAERTDTNHDQGLTAKGAEKYNPMTIGTIVNSSVQSREMNFGEISANGTAELYTLFIIDFSGDMLNAVINGGVDSVQISFNYHLWANGDSYNNNQYGISINETVWPGLSNKINTGYHEELSGSKTISGSDIHNQRIEIRFHQWSWKSSGSACGVTIYNTTVSFTYKTPAINFAAIDELGSIDGGNRPATRGTISVTTASIPAQTNLTAEQYAPLGSTATWTGKNVFFFVWWVPQYNSAYLRTKASGVSVAAANESNINAIFGYARIFPTDRESSGYGGQAQIWAGQSTLTYPYNGTAQGPEVLPLTVNGDGSYGNTWSSNMISINEKIYSGTMKNGKTYSSSSKPTAAGTYTLTANIYNAVGELSGTIEQAFEIEQAEVAPRRINPDFGAVLQLLNTYSMYGYDENGNIETTSQWYGTGSYPAAASSATVSCLFNWDEAISQKPENWIVWQFGGQTYRFHKATADSGEYTLLATPWYANNNGVGLEYNYKPTTIKVSLKVDALELSNGNSGEYTVKTINEAKSTVYGTNLAVDGADFLSLIRNALNCSASADPYHPNADFLAWYMVNHLMTINGQSSTGTVLTNVGTYTVKFTNDSNTDFKASALDNIAITLTITPRPLALEWLLDGSPHDSFSVVYKGGSYDVSARLTAIAGNAQSGLVAGQTLTINYSGVCSGTNAGSYSAGIASITDGANETGLLSNYSIETYTATRSWSITSKALEANAKSPPSTITKEYDGTTSAPVSITKDNLADYLNVTGLVGQDAVSGVFSVLSHLYNSKDVLEATKLLLNVTVNGNYTLTVTQYELTATITPKTLNVSINVSQPAITKVYDGTTAKPSVLTINSANLASYLDINNDEFGSGDSIANIFAVGAYEYNYATVVEGNRLLLNVTVNDNYTIALTQYELTASITPKSLTVGIQDPQPSISKVYDGTTSATTGSNALTINSANLASYLDIDTDEFGSGDSIANIFIVGTYEYNNATVEAGNKLLLNVSVNSNYTLDSDGTPQAAIYELTASITQKPLTVTAKTPTITKEYDGTTAGPITVDNLTDYLNINTGEFVNGATIATIFGVTSCLYDDKDVGTRTVTLIITVDPNYAVDDLTYDFDATITPKLLTVSINGSQPSISKVYDGTTNAPGTLEITTANLTTYLTIGGLVNGELAANVFAVGTYEYNNATVAAGNLLLLNVTVNSNYTLDADETPQAATYGLTASITPADL
ncbi:MAG: hypothetical protein LBQ40_00115, partial [Clostridiales bacterium]|nr:hypothetical protein [Clostridiales bacterium]